MSNTDSLRVAVTEVLADLENSAVIERRRVQSFVKGDTLHHLFANRAEVYEQASAMLRYALATSLDDNDD